MFDRGIRGQRVERRRVVRNVRRKPLLNQFIPSPGLVVAGDSAYDDVHLWLCGSNADRRLEWISAIDKTESLNPGAVVAPHRRPEDDDNPSIIEQTRQYIRDFDRLAETTVTAQALYDKMMDLDPLRVNPGGRL